MSYWMGLAAVSVVGAAATAVVVASPSSKNYGVSIATARDRLAAAPLPDMLTGLSGEQVTLIKVGDSLIWQLGQAGSGGEVRADLSADGATTDIKLTTAIKPDPLGGPVTAARIYRDMAEDIIAEHVDAVMSGRPFDAVKFAQLAAKRWQSNPAALAEFGEAVSDQKNAVSDMLSQDESFDRKKGGLDAVMADIEDQVKAAESEQAARAAIASSSRPTTDLSQY